MITQGPFWVFEAEYTVRDSIPQWHFPIAETIKQHGPFSLYEDARKACMGRMWANVDCASHRACVVTDPSFDPRQPNTHHMVVGAETYWGVSADLLEVMSAMPTVES